MAGRHASTTENMPWLDTDLKQRWRCKCCGTLNERYPIKPGDSCCKKCMTRFDPFTQTGDIYNENQEFKREMEKDKRVFSLE